MIFIVNAQELPEDRLPPGMLASSSSNPLRFILVPFLPDRARVELLPSVKTAERVPGVKEIADLPLTFEDVPVIRGPSLPPTTTPATTRAATAPSADGR